LATTGCPEAKLETEMENCPAARRRVSMTGAQDLLPVQATITQIFSRQRSTLQRSQHSPLQKRKKVQYLKKNLINLLKKNPQSLSQENLTSFLSIVLEFLPANARSIIVLLPSRPSRDECVLPPLQKIKK
jgi:hypothetical protein